MLLLVGAYYLMQAYVWIFLMGKATRFAEVGEFRACG